MPELPEVETVKRGLTPALLDATLEEVTAHRPDLRFPFPERFAARLQGARVISLDRRGKFILAGLDTGETWISHLGMSGRFYVTGQGTPGRFVHQARGADHIHMTLQSRDASGACHEVRYGDPRRFGYMDVVPTGQLSGCKHFAGMGPEPLSDVFTGPVLHERLAGRRTPIKSALLDQRVVAGLGNIYVCEALFRAGISPRRLAASVGAKRADRLVTAIKEVLAEAIDAGGSSLRDYAAADGTAGAFQMGFAVYGRTGEACPVCTTPIKRMVQSARSTFFCSVCQR